MSRRADAVLTVLFREAAGAAFATMFRTADAVLTLLFREAQAVTAKDDHNLWPLSLTLKFNHATYDSCLKSRHTLG